MTIVDTKNFQPFLQPYHNQQLFCVKCTQKFRHFFCICPTKVARICNWEDLIFGRWLNTVDARKIKIRLNIKSKACVVLEILLPRAKWLGFFPADISAIHIYCELNIPANTELFVAALLSVLKIISSLLIWPLLAREGLIKFQIILFVTKPSSEIFLKYFLILFTIRNTYLFHGILCFLNFILVEFLQKLFLNLLLYRLSQ